MEIVWKSVYIDGVFTGKLISNTGLLVREDGSECVLSDNGAGYLTYHVTSIRNAEGKWIQHRKYAHRLVAEYFLPNPLNLPQVNHKDCDKNNNSVDNLEWCTRRYNIEHAHEAKRMDKRSNYGPIAILTQDEVIECYTRVKRDGEGIAVVARSMNKPRTTISSIMNKRSRSKITDLLDEEFAELKRSGKT